MTAGQQCAEDGRGSGGAQGAPPPAGPAPGGDSIRSINCYREGQGEAILEFVADGAGNTAERLTFNERFECKHDGTLYQEPEPRLFSFNNPYGACPRCQGFGNTIDFDLNLVVPDPSKSFDEGAIEPWTKPRYRTLFQEAKKWARGRGIPTNVPWRQLSEEQRRLILEGDPETTTKV